MNAAGGKSRKIDKDNPSNTSLANIYATMQSMAIITAKGPMAGYLLLSMKAGAIRMGMAIGIIVSARDATRQTFCSGSVGKEKFHPKQ